MQRLPPALSPLACQFRRAIARQFSCSPQQHQPEPTGSRGHVSSGCSARRAGARALQTNCRCRGYGGCRVAILIFWRISFSLRPQIFICGVWKNSLSLGPVAPPSGLRNSLISSPMPISPNQPAVFVDFASNLEQLTPNNHSKHGSALSARNSDHAPESHPIKIQTAEDPATSRLAACCPGVKCSSIPQRLASDENQTSLAEISHISLTKLSLRFSVSK